MAPTRVSSSAAAAASKGTMEFFAPDKSVAAYGLQMSYPAVVALVGYLLIVLLILLPINMYSYDTSKQKYVKTEYNFGARLVLAILLLLPFLLSVYSVNCMMVGRCTLWSWVVAILTLVWAIVLVVSSMSTNAILLDQI